MYEKPELTLVGDASETILGIMPGGWDMDGTWVWQPNQFEVETLIEE